MAWKYLLSPTFQVVNTAGKPATGGYIEVYIHGTRDRYYCASDFDGTLHPFKIPLDSLGANIVLADDSQTYDVYVYNRYGSLIMSRYDVPTVRGKDSAYSGDVSDATSTFTKNELDLSSMASGMSLKSILTSISNFFAAIKKVAFSASYNDLSDKPSIPDAQVNSDWNANSGVAQILNKPSLATVATTGDYDDLSSKPIFVAKYGTTTYAEVRSFALTVGTTVVCQKHFLTAVLLEEHIDDDGYSFTFATPPNAKGQYHVFTLRNDDSWTDQIIERNHDLICQLKPIVYAGQTTMRYILCDRQKYTIENGAYIFQPVNLFNLATWINRGDVIQIDGAAAHDPWGDRYPMQITEMQCYTDSGTTELYCGNIRVYGYAYSNTEITRWGDTIVDEATNKRYLEFQTWT